VFAGRCQRDCHKNNWQAQVEYVTNLPTIMPYNVLSTPALVVDEKVLLTGHSGAAKVELALKQALALYFRQISFELANMGFP
jgi:4-aminobutyrate aminotransferase-like enzyme